MPSPFGLQRLNFEVFMEKSAIRHLRSLDLESLIIVFNNQAIGANFF